LPPAEVEHYQQPDTQTDAGITGFTVTSSLGFEGGGNLGQAGGIPGTSVIPRESIQTVNAQKKGCFSSCTIS
jgi:hypothetical protein